MSTNEDICGFCVCLSTLVLCHSNILVCLSPCSNVCWRDALAVFILTLSIINIFRCGGEHLWTTMGVLYRTIWPSLYSCRQRYDVYNPKGYRLISILWGHHPSSIQLCANTRSFNRYHISSTGSGVNTCRCSGVSSKEGETLALIRHLIVLLDSINYNHSTRSHSRVLLLHVCVVFCFMMCHILSTVLQL